MSIYHNDNADFLCKSIDSILNQTYQNFLFYIVIDGEIPKQLSDTLDQYKNQEKINILKNIENSGLAHSMNKIIALVIKKHPECEYFFRMDADDISFSHRFEKQVRFLKKHPRVSILGSDCEEICTNGNYLGQRLLPVNHKAIVKSLPRHCPINHPTVVIRTKVFLDGYNYNENINLAEDYDLWVRLTSAGYIFHNIQENLLQYRRSGNFYNRRGFHKAFNDHTVRKAARLKLKQNTLKNRFYSYCVLALRLSPTFMIKFAYKLLEFRRKALRKLS